MYCKNTFLADVTGRQGRFQVFGGLQNRGWGPRQRFVQFCRRKNAFLSAFERLRVMLPNFSDVFDQLKWKNVERAKGSRLRPGRLDANRHHHETAQHVLCHRESPLVQAIDRQHRGQANLLRSRDQVAMLAAAYPFTAPLNMDFPI